MRQKRNERNLEPYAEVPLANIATCEASFRDRPIANRPVAGQKYLVNTKGIRPAEESNYVAIRDDKGRVIDMYTNHVGLNGHTQM